MQSLPPSDYIVAIRVKHFYWRLTLLRCAKLTAEANCALLISAFLLSRQMFFLKSLWYMSARCVFLFSLCLVNQQPSDVSTSYIRVGSKESGQVNLEISTKELVFQM